MNYYKTYSMKSFFCLIALVLTFSFSFANEKSLINTQNSASYSQFKKVNDIAVLTISYDIATFCAGATGISKPKVSETGGVFILTRKSPGTGSLAFNNTSGEIDYSISNPGVYTMTYKKGDASVSTTITVNKCN
jgi:hypothetical protein